MTKAGSYRAALDILTLKRLLFDSNRKAAALYIGKYLSGQPDANDPSLAGRWLELAIFQAWPENLSPSSSLAESKLAYENFKKLKSSAKEDSLTKSNRLLYQSFLLSADSAFIPAADSLLASISMRPRNKMLNDMILADSYEELAKLDKIKGDLFESVRNYQRSIAINRKLNRRKKLANDLTNLGYTISKMNPDNPKAESDLNEALEIFTSIDSAYAEAQVLNELGALYDNRGDNQKSMYFFKKSLAKKNQIPGLKKDEFTVVLSNIGTAYEYMGKVDSARFYFLKAVESAKESRKNLSECYINLGASYGRRSEYKESIVYFQKAINCLDTLCSPTDPRSNPQNKIVSRRLMDITSYKAYSFHLNFHETKKIQDLKNGLDAYLSALNLVDTLRFIYSFEGKPFLSAEAKIHYFHALDVALDLYENTGDRRYLDTAFILSERNKSSVLNEFLRSNVARGNAKHLEPWLKNQDEIKHRKNLIEATIIKERTKIDPDLDTIAVLNDRVSDLTDELKNLAVKAKQEHPGYFQTIYRRKTVTPESVREHLNQNEALIDYTVVHDTRLALDYMIVMVLTKDTLYTYRDTLDSNFRKDIEKFRSTITSFVDTKVYQDFCRLSNLMYRYFFEPIEKFRGINKLIILPDEDIGLIPFEVFVSDTIKPRGSDFRKLSYLNRKYQISYISSHEQLLKPQTQPNNKSKARVYAFAPFASQGEKIDNLTLLQLSSSAEEANSVARYFKTKIFLDKKAGEKNLRAALKKRSLVTLSTHGIVNTEIPLESRLLLNQSQVDGSLYLFEMLSMEINSPMVILNACNSGMGKLQVGEGILSMARGFQFAGVRTVITTLWPIDDQASASVMDFFFKNLNSGMESGEALMKARNSYIDQSSKANGAPFFWAGQVLIGDPGPIELQPRDSKPLWVFVLGFAAIISLILIIYKKRR